VFVALKDTIERCDLPIDPLRNLLTAFTMDLSVNRYPTWHRVEGYCAHSAHPVGRLFLYIFDYRDPSLHRYSDDICTALQLTNFLQDVGVDVAKDRIYLPQEDLLHFGVAESQIYARQATPAFRDLMRFEVARARALLERGRPLLETVGRDLAFELTMIWHGGNTILDKLEAVDYDVFRKRPTLGATDKAFMMARAATRNWPWPR
jgi:squalene synthase HpnC